MPMTSYLVTVRVTTEKTLEEIQGTGGANPCTWTDAVGFDDDIVVVTVDDEPPTLEPEGS